MRASPVMKLKETLPFSRSSRELEKTMKATHAGSMHRKVVTAYGVKPILVRPKA